MVKALPGDAEPVIRLYKAPAASGRLKLQLFPLSPGEAHPPHAHYNLISCQVVLQGRVRMREYSLLRRRDGNILEVREEPLKELAPGDGVITLLEKNNIHWQEGLEPGTVLLNINWQGYFDQNPELAMRSSHGRCYIDWDSAERSPEPGVLVVPEIMPEDRQAG